MNELYWPRCAHCLKTVDSFIKRAVHYSYVVFEAGCHEQTENYYLSVLNADELSGKVPLHDAFTR